MPSVMKHKLSVAVFPWRRFTDDGKMVHRYMAFGVVQNGEFSGMVHDYQGGGTYADVLFLNGKPMKDEDRDEDLILLDKKFPGLMDAIEKERGKIATYSGNDGQWWAKKRFADAFMTISQGDEHFVLETGPMIPEMPLIGNTFFSRKKVSAIKCGGCKHELEDFETCKRSKAFRQLECGCEDFVRFK